MKTVNLASERSLQQKEFEWHWLGDKLTNVFQYSYSLEWTLPTAYDWHACGKAKD